VYVPENSAPSKFLISIKEPNSFPYTPSGENALSRCNWLYGRRFEDSCGSESSLSSSVQYAAGYSIGRHKSEQNRKNLPGNDCAGQPKPGPSSSPDRKRARTFWRQRIILAWHHPDRE
jgi:hypothetical protein